LKKARSITLTFLNKLSDALLNKILPRKKLNTIRLQTYEPTLGQAGFVDSLATKIAVSGDECSNYISLPTHTLVEK